ncbi:MAG: Holliday junction resolvase RuvX [Firmicutes bacterium]|nr:Holliday junction resolvase RuvX [Bacillota bacterium]
MRIMGLDLGSKTIGVAISDPLGWTAQGLTTLTRTAEPGNDLERLKELIIQHQVEQVVVGLPRNMDGSYGPQAEKARQFAAELAEECQLPVTLWDERLSTVAAERALLAGDVSRRKRRQVIDKMAAVLILQNYLDRQR